MRIGLREANQQFSRVMRVVKGGRTVVLTERGRPIAVIRPLAVPTDLDAGAQRLLASGLLRVGPRKGPMPPRQPRSIRGAPLGVTIRQERDESW